MTNPGAGLVRLARAGVLTALIVILTVLAHRVGGGATPTPFALVALGAVLWPGALLATRRRLRSVTLLLGLGAGQLLGHGLLAWLGGSGAPAAASSVSIECLQHAAHGAASAACAHDGVAVVAAGAQSHAHAGSSTSLLMLSAHVVATVLLALVLAHGERVLWRVLELALRALPVLVSPVAVRSPRAAAPLVLLARLDRAVLAGRGPPAYAA